MAFSFFPLSSGFCTTGMPEVGTIDASVNCAPGGIENKNDPLGR